MLKEEIDQDVLGFFNKIEGLSFDDKRKMLRLMLEKYSLLSKADCILDRIDILSISSKAKSNMAREQAVIHMGERSQRLNYDEVRMLHITDAVVSVLNTKECFKRLPKFDIRDGQYQEGDV